jgi:O-antigen/teichoic acid export membrane protein
VGVYGFGYNVGNLQQVVANSGNSVLMPKYGKAQSDGTVRIELPGRFLNYIGWMAAAALAISIFSDEIISILMPPSFAGSAAIVPWVTLGFFCVALYYGPMNGLTLLAGETRWVWLITFAAGAVNIVANIIFVPIFGIQAAAVNTLIGYLTLFILVAFYSKRFDIPRYPWIKIALICLGLVVGVVVDKLSVLETVWEVTTDIVILGLFWTAFVRPLESKAK